MQLSTNIAQYKTKIETEAEIARINARKQYFSDVIDRYLKDEEDKKLEEERKKREAEELAKLGPPQRKRIKQLQIFTSIDDFNKMAPSLVDMIGNCVLLSLDDQNHPALVEFVKSANYYHTISIMLYIENDEPDTPFSAVSFTVPKLTIVYNIKRYVRNGDTIRLPFALFDVLCSPNNAIVIPGKADFIHTRLGYDTYADFRTFANLPTSLQLKPLDEYFDKLHLLKTGAGVCNHIKLVCWIFQFKFDYTKNGRRIIRYDDINLLRMMHRYGSVLLYLFWALDFKERLYLEDDANSRKFGPNTEPIYIEDILINKRIVDLDHQTLHRILFGKSDKGYPNPPYPPNIARTTKNVKAKPQAEKFKEYCL